MRATKLQKGEMRLDRHGELHDIWVARDTERNEVVRTG